MMNKVKDALSSDKSHEQDAYNTSSSGKHGQSSMPGAFDSDIGNTSSSRHTGTEGYGTAHSTDQRHVPGSGVGHDAAYQRATDPSNTTSKYASGPTQSSNTQDNGTSGITGGTHRDHRTPDVTTSTHTSTTQHGTGYGRDAGSGIAGGTHRDQGTSGITSGITGGTHRDAGYGTGAGAGAAGAGAGALGGHTHRKEVPDSNIMDPSDRERGSNIMDRSRADYAEDSSSGPNKLHKREDPRGNQDHSGLVRSAEDGVLRREQGSGGTGQSGYDQNTSGSRGIGQSGYGDNTSGSRGIGQSGYGDNTSGSRYDQTGGTGTTRQGGHGDTIGGSRYEDQPSTGSSDEPRHKSDMLNKLDPRVKTDTEREKYQDKDSGYSSKHHDRDSDRHGAGYGGATSGGAGAAAAAAAGTHSSRNDRNDRGDHGTQRSSDRDNIFGGTHGSHKEHGTHGTHSNDRSLPTRTRDEYGTGATGAEHGNFGREHAQGGYSTQPGSTHDPRYGAAGSGPGTTAAGAAALGTDRHGRDHDSHKDRQGSQPVPYSMNAAHTQGHDPATSAIHGARSHFHCMGCGHKNDASHLRDHQGQPTSRSELHCMNCGHRNQVGHLLGQRS